MTDEQMNINSQQHAHCAVRLKFCGKKIILLALIMASFPSNKNIRILNIACDFVSVPLSLSFSGKKKNSAISSDEWTLFFAPFTIDNNHFSFISCRFHALSLFYLATSWEHNFSSAKANINWTHTILKINWQRKHKHKHTHTDRQTAKVEQFHNSTPEKQSQNEAKRTRKQNKTKQSKK